MWLDNPDVVKICWDQC